MQSPHAVHIRRVISARRRVHDAAANFGTQLGNVLTHCDISKYSTHTHTHTHARWGGMGCAGNSMYKRLHGNTFVTSAAHPIPPSQRVFECTVSTSVVLHCITKHYVKLCVRSTNYGEHA